MTTWTTVATTPEDRADLAEAMVPKACEFACLVHDGDRDAIAAFLAGLDEDESLALPVILAAMVPIDDRSPADLLAWVGGGPVTVLPGMPGRRWAEPEAEPVPDGHTPQELRDAAAEAMRLRRAGRVVPEDLAALVLAYRQWRKQVQEVRGPAGSGGQTRAA